MDREWDVVVCGTGLLECLLGTLLSLTGRRVLFLDRNCYYGADAASVDVVALWSRFLPGEQPQRGPPSSRGRGPSDWRADLAPKLMVTNGTMIKLLEMVRAVDSLEWKAIEGSFVYQHFAPRLFASKKLLHKVPSPWNLEEVWSSPLMTLLEKNRVRRFVNFVMDWDVDSPASLRGFDPHAHTMRLVYEDFGLCADTICMIGRTIALRIDDQYLDEACGSAIAQIKCSLESFMYRGDSPFVFPDCGLGGLTECFSRMAARNASAFVTSADVDGFEHGPDGRVCGVRCDGQVIKCAMVVCEPSYAPPARVRVVRRIIRAVCILGAPIPGTQGVSSCQIIIPEKQLSRRNAIYISVTPLALGRDVHKYVAVVSTVVETDEPDKEILPALRLMGNIEQTFSSVCDFCIPADDDARDQVFITESCDEATHCEGTAEGVRRVWKQIFGADLDLTLSVQELRANPALRVMSRPCADPAGGTTLGGASTAGEALAGVDEVVVDQSIGDSLPGGASGEADTAKAAIFCRVLLPETGEGREVVAAQRGPPGIP